MLNSNIKKIGETFIDTKDFLNFLKQSINKNYTEFIKYKTLELFESIKSEGEFLPYVNNLQFEIKNYEVYNNTLECLIGSEKIVWSMYACENDMRENLIKLDFLGVKKINLEMFYDIIKFLLLEKILLCEQEQFKKILELQEKIYYSILRKGIDNCKIQINLLRKKIKNSNLKIIKKMDKLSIINNKIVFEAMKAILENRYIGLNYEQFICLIFPELYCMKCQDISNIIQEIEGEFEVEEIVNEFETEMEMEDENFEMDDNIQEEVALFETQSVIKKIIKK